MATQDYTKPSTYTTPDGKRTAELDYQRETLTVFEGTALLTVLPMSFTKLDTINMHELRQIVEGATATTEEPAQDTTGEHVCDEATEHQMYRQYISDGLADTDGYYAPKPFDAWRADYHRSIGHTEHRTADCTTTECNAPRHEKVKLVTHLEPGSRRKVQRYESICRTCYDARRATGQRI